VEKRGKTRIKKRRDKKKAEKQQKKRQNDRGLGGGRKQTGTLYTPGIYLTCSKSL